MNAAIISLAALLVVIVVSVTSNINVGVLAIALGALVALLAAGWTANELMAAFPAPLFLTLVGVTLLFAVAQKNGTLEAITARVVRLCGGNTALLPIAFFLLTGMLSSVGPGAIIATAIMAPLAMSAGLSAGVPAFLIALMVANGANAGNLSPVSAVGIIVHAQMDKAGLPDHALAVFLANFVAHTAVAAAAYVLFGGRQLLRAGRVAYIRVALPAVTVTHWITIAVLLVWIAAVVGFEANPGIAAFIAATVLILARTGDDKAAVGAVPWAVILMVCGVSVLIGVLDKTGGMDLFTSLLANITSPAFVNGMMAFVTGLISTYSSTSGVVYPAFLPTVPGLVEKLGGGNPLEIALSINVGAALVDVSPLSTIGALAIAAVPAGAADTTILFRKMLIWGFAMTAVGAIFCQLFIGFFAF
jgi:Na+/H+ antiporter NhaD/arsenite permease-like protein